ncbi:MAG: hypothetical protein CSA66_01095 [Proteobacteria bacterium]|nr:MAG: hypothetical protein CSA66_01095 [Pseudomonadota bacterium]
MHRLWTKSIAALVAIFFAVPTARAYVWYTSDSGDKMRWFRPELTFRVSTVEPEEVSWDEMYAIVEASVASWDIAGCKIPQVDVVGSADARTITTPTTLGEEPDNILVFIRSVARWNQLPGASRTQIALTFIAHDPQTGEIIDADIAVNDASYDFTTREDAAVGIDLQAAITHEFGHFFGMDHSLDTAATMFANYGLDQSQRAAARTLEADDQDGVCALYEDVPTWSGGGGGGGGGALDDSCAAGGSPAPVAAALGALLLLALSRRRHRAA